jgi:hypothetical protein
MTFDEWVEKYGVESARRQFRVSDHLVLVVHPGKRVTGTCGDWHGSEPLGNPTRNPDVETAKQRLRDALCGVFETEETIEAVEPYHPSHNFMTFDGMNYNCAACDCKPWHRCAKLPCN